ncbi:hypothetical protein I4U23_016198 [Adineta vaga]|nr:hypothetical protein I4U23_016198 [Adineta vaga]
MAERNVSHLEYQGAPVLESLNVNLVDIFSQAKKLPSFFNRTQQIVSRFRCLKGWKQFGGSCYYPSIMITIADKANRTCYRLYGNNTHVMRIRHVAELSYAAHLYMTYNLTELLIETDPQLLKSKIFVDSMLTNEHNEWQIMEDKLYEAVGKNESEENIDIYSSDNEKDIFERFNNIRGLCHQFAWNVLNNNSHVFLFSTYKISNKLICSLNDIDLNSTYEYVCQYVLDFCFGNVICGKHGECRNIVQGFKCSCSALYDGVLCEKVAQKAIQMIIGGILIIILSFFQCCKSQTTEKNEKNDKKTPEDKLRRKRSIGVIILFLTFFFPLLIIPAAFQYQSFPTHDIDSLKLHSLIDKALSMFQKCERKSLLPRNDLIFLIISIIFTVVFLVCERKSTENHSSPKNLPSKQHQSMSRPSSNTECNNPEADPLLTEQSRNETVQSSGENIPLSETLTPLKVKRPASGLSSLANPIDKTNRYKIAAIFGILTSEILIFFDEILLAISGTSNDGIIIILLKRILITMLIGFRYYPILFSLRLQHVIPQFLTFIYIIGIIIYTIIRQSFCLDFLPHSENFSAKDEIQLRIKLGTRFITYGLIANLPHLFLLSYSGAEFGMRLIFTLCGKKPKDYEKQSHPKPIQVSRSTIDNQSFLDRIYKWDDDFSFTSMVISIYTVNFIILYHLSCTFTFLYTTRMMSPILFIINILEQLFNIDVRDNLFHSEICISIVATALIYAIQLCFGMKIYREDIKNYHKEDDEISKEMAKKVKEKQMRSRSTQYPGYLIRYTIGGFVITFHLIILITILLHMIWLFSHSFKWILELIVPILILYLLQSLMAKSSSRFIDLAHGRNNNLKNKLANVIQYFILVASKTFLYENLPEIDQREPKPSDDEEQVTQQPSEIGEEVSDSSSVSFDNIQDSILFNTAQNFPPITTNNNRGLNREQEYLLRNWKEIEEKRKMNELESADIRQQLNGIGCKMFEIQGDGNCFFRAISHQLNRRYDHLNIRSEAINYLMRNRRYFAPFIHEDIGPTVDDYIERMTENGTYADHPIILSTAAVLNQNIIIHEKGKQPWLIPGSDDITNQLHVWYDGNHYSSVITTNDNLPNSYLPQMLANGYNINISISNMSFCRFRYYITFVLACWEPSCLILASIDRTLITSSNASTRKLSTSRFIITTIIVICLFWAIFHVHALIYVQILQYGPDYFICYHQPGAYTTFVSYYSLFINGLLPPVLMLTFGCWTVKNIRRIRLATFHTGTTNLNVGVIGRPQILQRRDRQMIRMLLVDLIIGCCRLYGPPLLIARGTELHLSLPGATTIPRRKRYLSMNSQYKLRRAIIVDVDALSKLSRRTFAETFVEDFAIPYSANDINSYYQLSTTPEYFAKKICNDLQYAVWVIEDEQTKELVAYSIAGYCDANDFPHPDVQSGKDGAVNRLYVQRDRQTYGFGQQLMNAMLLWLEEHCPNRPIWLSVLSENYKAQKFYKHYGFIKVGEYDYPVGEWKDREFIMKLEIHT